MPLKFDPDALDALSRLSRHDSQRLLDKIQWLWDNREAVNHLALSGNLSGFYKRRLGKFRIIYTYDANPDDLIIRMVGLRDDIYKNPL